MVGSENTTLHKSASPEAAGGTEGAAAVPDYLPAGVVPAATAAGATEAPLRELNVRQRRFVAELVGGAPSAAEAYRRAGYGVKAAADAASRLGNDISVRQEIRRTLEAAGLTRETMAVHLASLLDVRKYGISKDGDRIDVGRDGSTAQKALELAYRLDDALPNPKLDVDMALRGAVVVLRADDLLGGDAFADAPGEVIDVSPAASD